MNTEAEMKAFLEDQRIIRPLTDKWCKKDYVLPSQACLVYYGIEPSLDSFPSDIQILNKIDHLGMFDILMSSKFILTQQRDVDLHRFVNWLKEKGFEIPKHLTFGSGIDNYHKNPCQLDKQELIQFDMRKLRPEQCAKVASRAIAALVWKKDKKISASEFVKQNNKFKKLREVLAEVDADFDEETFVEWISDMSPRSTKRK